MKIVAQNIWWWFNLRQKSWTSPCLS